MKKTTSHLTRTAAVLAAGFLFPFTASAQTILFEDDFDGGVTEEPPTIPPWTEVAGPDVLVKSDSGDLFGRGTDNQYLDFNGSGDVSLVEASNVLTGDDEVVTLSFDFYEPDGAKQHPLIIFLYGGDGTARVERLRLTHGGTGASAPAPEDRVYELDTHNQLDWIVNNSSEPVSYLSGTRTIEPGESDVWVNGSLILSGYSYENFEAGAIRGLDFRTFSSLPDQQVFIDDVKLLAGTSVRLSEPETPLIELLFEGNLTNTGSLGGEASFVHEREDDPNYNWEWQNRATLGEGLGGDPDSGLDNTQVGGMGDYGQGEMREGGVFLPGTGLQELESVTIASWFKTPAETPWSSNAFMVGWANGLDYQHQIAPGDRVFLNVPYTDGGSAIRRRQFSLNNIIDDTAVWQQFTERWTFQAVTFDGTTGTMSFYYAYEDSTGVSHNVTRQDMETGPLRNLSIEVAFANNYFGTRPFKGQLDNVRIYGSKEDGSGALSQAELTTIWLEDLAAATEEPGALAVNIVDFDHDGAEFSVSFESETDVTYTVERSSDLVTWDPVHTVSGDGSVLTYSESVDGADRLFYRVRAEHTE